MYIMQVRRENYNLADKILIFSPIPLSCMMSPTPTLSHQRIPLRCTMQLHIFVGAVRRCAPPNKGNKSIHQFPTGIMSARIPTIHEVHDSKFSLSGGLEVLTSI
jgi:hypothetical protein